MPFPPLAHPFFLCYDNKKPKEIEAVSMRIMAIDYGDAHTGIAISDPTGFLAGYTTVINAYRPEVVVDNIAALVQEYGVEELVLGHPINMDGTRGPRSEKAQAMKALLEERFPALPVVLWDERRTTIDAHQILFNSGKNAKKRKKVVDAVAASLILEGYLTFKRTR